ncbi:MAG: carbamoyltransferase N-terminal domain-containing protein [Pseudomonadota bacterium]
MVAVLGISAFYHDAAAALIVDGKIVAAAQEERFSRTKHDPRFPLRAVQYCLDRAGMSAAGLDVVAFYDKPLRTFDRLLETYLRHAPRGFLSFFHAMPPWLNEKLMLPRHIRRGLGGRYKKGVVFAPHHESHAASAFLPSPFERSAILTLDGVGEWATGTIGLGEGSRIQILKELRFPHSLGLLYSAVTGYCGFKVNSGEYKLMGLAPFGAPRHVATMRQHLVDVREDGSLRLDMRYFDFAHGLRMTSRSFHELFGAPPRAAESELRELDMDLAASIQVIAEEVVIQAARHAQALTRERHLCMAGGVALNCVANGRLLREGIFDRIWVQPAAGDAGGALGVALLASHQLLGDPRERRDLDSQQGSFLGPDFDDDAIRSMLESRSAVFYTAPDDQSLVESVAQELASGRVVGWFQGRMEFGPRALGARSILADAMNPRMQSTLNLKIKFRESFRPFAPIVLRERVHEWFDVPSEFDSPYMLFTAPVRGATLTAQSGDEDVRRLDRIKETRSRIPAVTHIDGSARLQTVDAQRHPLLHALLAEFDRVTGCPVLVNTSFNVRGEPIVCTPEDAHRCFAATHMDTLVLGHHVVHKSEQPDQDPTAVARYLASIPAD